MSPSRTHRLATAFGPTTSRSYHCVCGGLVFLRNTACLRCGRALGYETTRRTMVALEPAPDPGQWVVAGEATGPRYQRCANLDTAAHCNWIIPVAAPDGAMPPGRNVGLYAGRCLACSVTRTTPDLGSARNQELWRRLETTKRRLISQLLALALPVETRLQRSDGLAFDLLEHVPGGPPVLTGHEDGVITINIAEADDAERERMRADLREPYRTLLGHFRHEVGHHYWDRLIRGTPWLPDFRGLFGDESQDYTAALQVYYGNGPPADWALRHVTRYAASHPWEDWAETWAHYLHMADTVDTAVSYGLDAGAIDIEAEPFGPADLWQPDDPNAERFLAFLNSWVVLTQAMNELSRSMGQPDLYPFVLPRVAVAKLQFIHEVIRSASLPPG